MNTSRKKLCRICFAVIVTITFILWCIWIADVWKNDVGDDIFPPHFMMFEFGCIFLAIPLVQEFILYKSISYFWATEMKTRGKTWFYIILLAVDIAVHVSLFDRYLTFFYRMLFQTLFG